MKVTLNKNTITSILLIIISCAIIYRITPVHVTKNIEVTINKNRTSISNIHQTRDITKSFKVKLDKLNLYHKGKFGHPKLGNIAKASDDFFLDIDQNFTITKEGNYQFLVGSDDGFSLKIDGKTLCEHTNDRPYSVQSCTIYLNKGKHQLQASYFQGFGNSGFTLQYKTPDGKTYWFGEKSVELELAK
jgi:hypothetical protein